MSLVEDFEALVKGLESLSPVHPVPELIALAKKLKEDHTVKSAVVESQVVTPVASGVIEAPVQTPEAVGEVVQPKKVVPKGSVSVDDVVEPGV